MSSGRLWLWAFGMVVVAFLIAPIFVIIIVSLNDNALFSFPPTAWSLRWYRALWDSRSFRNQADRGQPCKRQRSGASATLR